MIDFERMHHQIGEAGVPVAIVRGWLLKAERSYAAGVCTAVQQLLDWLNKYAEKEIVAQIPGKAEAKRKKREVRDALAVLVASIESCLDGVSSHEGAMFLNSGNPGRSLGSSLRVAKNALEGVKDE